MAREKRELVNCGKGQRAKKQTDGEMGGERRGRKKPVIALHPWT